VSPKGDSLYVAVVGSNVIAIFARDERTGVLTQLPGPSGCISEDRGGGACADGVALVEAASVVVTRNGRSVYVASKTSDAVSAFDRDRASTPRDDHLRNFADHLVDYGFRRSERSSERTRIRDPVHSEHARRRLVYVDREDVPERRLDQDAVRLDPPLGRVADAVAVQGMIVYLM